MHGADGERVSYLPPPIAAEIFPGNAAPPVHGLQRNRRKGEPHGADARTATRKGNTQMKNIEELGKTREAIKPVFTPKEVAEIKSKFNIGTVVRALAGDTVDVGYESEISDEAIRRETNGQRSMTLHGGYYIPDFILCGTRTLGKTPAGDITGNGAPLVATELLADETVSPLEARLVLTKLGVRFLDDLVGDITIPKASSVAASWLTVEGAAAQKFNPTFAQLNGSPHTCGSYVEITRKLAIQTSKRAQAFVSDLILRSCARALEEAAVGGTGASGQPLGLVNTSGVTTDVAASRHSSNRRCSSPA